MVFPLLPGTRTPQYSSWPVLPAASCPRDREETSYPQSRKYKAMALYLHEVDARFSCGTPAVIGKESSFASVRAYFTSLVLLRDGRHTHLPS